MILDLDETVANNFTSKPRDNAMFDGEVHTVRRRHRVDSGGNVETFETFRSWWQKCNLCFG